MAIELLASFQTQRMIIRRYSEEAYQKTKNMFKSIFHITCNSNDNYTFGKFYFLSIVIMLNSTAKNDLNHQNVSCALRNVVNTIAPCNMFR